MKIMEADKEKKKLDKKSKKGEKKVRGKARTSKTEETDELKLVPKPSLDQIVDVSLLKTRRILKPEDATPLAFARVTLDCIAKKRSFQAMEQKTKEQSFQEQYNLVLDMAQQNIDWFQLRHQYVSNTGKHVDVFYLAHDMGNKYVATLEATILIHALHYFNVEHAIVVLDRPFSSSAVRLVDQYCQSETARAQTGGPPKRVERFRLSELQFNLLESEYVPNHTIVPRDQVDSILKSLHVTASQLPVLPVFDPVARFIGAVSGDLVRIERIVDVGTMFEIAYRFCCEPTCRGQSAPTKDMSSGKDDKQD